ncbi:cytochrome b [Alteromonas sp. ASW11-36]|uniref:Cytochrome b n=1 Tax=Alteromonas arenosi TaxID=3055817 RepID=A0ABT7SUN4_9ALTE|nr:cytochrome b [Alteromonas sp. ASW11-36]MDM7859903.1 cytochrome b [Alteromonas sp. ASW11-36]
MSSPHRYHSIAIVLHWVIALALLFMFASGLYMVNVDISKAEQFRWFQIHKSAGVLMLWAIVLRLIVRWFSKQPSLPIEIPQNEHKQALWGHRLLYVALILMPLTGWMMVSASSFGLPTIVFDWFKWPHIPGVRGNETVESLARLSHWYIALAFMVFISIHIAAVVKHKYRDKVNLLPRMWWSRSQ